MDSLSHYTHHPVQLPNKTTKNEPSATLHESVPKLYQALWYSSSYSSVAIQQRLCLTTTKLLFTSSTPNERGFSISRCTELKRDGQRENTAVSFRRKAIAVSHPSFNAGGDASVPYRSLLFRDARQRAKCSMGDLERPRNTTTAETKRPFKTTGLIYERGRETCAKLIVGNARAGQRYVQDILSLAPGPVESLGGRCDRFLWFSMVMSLIWAARPSHRRTRDIRSTSCGRTTSTTASVLAANGFQRGVHSGLRSKSSLEFGFSSVSKCRKPHEMLRSAERFH